MTSSRIRKVVLNTMIILVVMAVVVIIFISPIAKFLIKKYDKKLLGRQVQLSWVYLNPFTGYAHFKNLKILEENNDSVFFSTTGLSLNVNLTKLLHKTFEISGISLKNPVAWIKMDKKKLNFDDLIQKFAPKNAENINKEGGEHFSFLNIKIRNGEFHYIEKSIPVNYFIKKVNIESTGKIWNVDSIAFHFAFSSGPSTGDIKGNGSIRLSDLNYRLAFETKNYDLRFIQQYLHDLARYGNFEANLDAKLNATGNLNDNQEIQASGFISLNDFHFGKSRGDDYASFDKLILNIKQLEPKAFAYIFDSFILEKPFLRYEKYDHLDNLQRMFGEKGASIKAGKAQRNEKFNLIIEIAYYVKELAKNFFRSNYKIGRVALYNGDLQFNDYSLNERFSIDADPFSLKADSINKKNNRVNLAIRTKIKPYGNVSVNLSLNPKDTGEFDLNYRLRDLPLAVFNPYLITYTSFPADRGRLDFHGTWTVRKGIIKSNNHLLLIDPHLAKHLNRRDEKRLPVPLILSFIRQSDNSVDYEIPVTGNLRDPKFNLWDVILDLLGNIFIKPPSLPYLVHVDHVNDELDKFLTVKWMTRRTTFSPSQEKFVEKMKDFLKDSPEASISVTPIHFEEKEKEYILFYEAKKKYYLFSHNLEEQAFKKEDSLQVDKMSVKDSHFVRYLNKQAGDSMLFTIQQKCNVLLGKRSSPDSQKISSVSNKIVNDQFLRLIRQRENKFRSYFNDNGTGDRIKFLKGENGVPFDGFSFYKIEYKGDIPKKLKDAYRDLYELFD